jgi:hypothetical protein
MYSTSTNDLLLETLNDKGTPPRTRIKDAKSAREIYHKLLKADEESARNRAAIDEMFAGAPPYDDAELRATGQAARANVNFGEADALLEAALAGYVDLLSSVETLVNFKTKFGDPQERIEHEQIVSEELTRMLRGWNAYTPNWLRLATHFVAHGVGIAYFESDLDWRWRVGGWSDFLIPRKTLASESEIEVACCARSMQAQQLFRYIEDGDKAAELGWDVKVAKKAIQEAMSNSATVGGHATDWEGIVREMKNNDLYMGVATASEIKIVHLWNVEFDGRVTHSIVLRDENSGNEGFLYRKVGKFSRMEQAFTIFTYGVGVNGQYHSIRGLGAKIFTEIQTSNRLRCQMVDGALLSSSVILQPSNEEALQNLQLSYFGPYSILTPGVEIQERAIPNMSTSVMPVLQDMARLINSRTSGYQASAADVETREKTKYEIQAQQSDRARLSTSALSLFYDPLERLFREVVRRVCRRDYYPAEPGGDAVREFKKRCVERGVPIEAIYSVDIARVTSVRAIGAGSEQMRQLTFDEFTQLAPSFDEFGRQNLLRDRVAARIGYANADRYVQKPSAENRPLMDEKFANLENNTLLTGAQLPVYPNDNHTVHSRAHIQALSEGVAGVQESSADMVQILPGLVALLEHATQHVDAMSSDPTVKEEAAGNRKILSQLSEIVTNGAKHVEKLRRESEGNPQQPQMEGSADSDLKIQQRIAENQLKLEHMREVANLKNQLRVEESLQKRALRDAETADKLAARV